MVILFYLYYFYWPITLPLISYPVFVNPICPWIKVLTLTTVLGHAQYYNILSYQAQSLSGLNARIYSMIQMEHGFAINIGRHYVSVHLNNKYKMTTKYWNVDILKNIWLNHYASNRRRNKTEASFLNILHFLIIFKYVKVEYLAPR